MCKKYVNLSLQIWRQKLFVQKVSETAENGYRFIVKKLRLDGNIDSKSLNQNVHNGSRKIYATDSMFMTRVK